LKPFSPKVSPIEIQNVQIKNKKMKKEFQAGTKDEQRTTADSSTSASVEASPMLSAALSVKEGKFQIAKFVGYTYGSSNETIFKNCLNDLHSYDKDWNKLMPVVKKIQQLEVSEFYRKKPVMSALIDVDIETLFKAVVVFTQWFNRQSVVSVGSR
jgi:hypothetical protein